MFQNNPLLAQLKQQIQETLPKKEGTIRANDKGFGFLEVDNKTSFFIPPPYMKKCMHGDKVLAIVRTENGKEVAEPQEMVEPFLGRFIGRIKLFKGKLNVAPDHPQLSKLSLRARVNKSQVTDTLNEGDWVVGQLIGHPLKGDDGFMVEVTKKITDADDKIAPWWVTLAESDLPNASPIGKEIWTELDAELERKDLLTTPFVTIDSASTKDIDDALFARKIDNDRYELTIAIADPTAYIAAGDETDKEALNRGFTIYLPGRNIPMLPRELADDLCSLKEGEQRPALCCTVTIEADGTIADDIAFFNAQIKSHGKLTYDNVSDYLDDSNTSPWQPDTTIVEGLNALHEVAKRRAAWRETNAVVFPDRPDYRFELSDDNDVIAIHADFRRSAHRLVEELMITANICAGRTLAKSNFAAIYNVHRGFKPEKLDDVIELIKTYHPEHELEQITELTGFTQLRRWLGHLESTYLDNRIRKYQSYSEISPEAGAHFAMGLDCYATWTSPIRKYGDMINHRLLKSLIAHTDPVQHPDLALCDHLSLKKRHHRMAERNIADWLYVRTLSTDAYKDAHFHGEIFDVSRGGMRVRLLENGAAAFIPNALICNNRDRIESSADKGMILIDNLEAYKLGDVIEVKLARIDQENRSLVAEPVALLSAPIDTPA